MVAILSVVLASAMPAVPMRTNVAAAAAAMNLVNIPDILLLRARFE